MGVSRDTFYRYRELAAEGVWMRRLIVVAALLTLRTVPIGN